MAAADKDQFRSVQALRAVAALMVVMFHVTQSAWVIGAAGVDIFFVISGFIMGTIGLKEKPAEFMGKRLIRVVPLYWGMTIAMCMAALVPGLFANFSPDAGMLIKSLLFIPFSDAEGNLFPLMVVGWTLNYEMFFYAVFALGLWLRKPLLLCFAVMGLLAAIAFIWHPTADIPRFYLNPILLEFAAGLAFSQWLLRLPRWLGPVFLLAGLAAFAMVAGLKSDGGLYRLFVWGLPAMLVVAGAILTEKKIGWSPVLRPLELVGDWSYSLYILHPIIVSLGHKVFGHSVPVNLLIIAVSIGAAFICYEIVEKRVSKILRNLFLPRKVAQPAQ